MRKLLLPFLALCIFACGCATSTFRYSEPDKDDVHYTSQGHRVAGYFNGMITGVYLFYFIPIWSGHPRNPNRHEYDTFQHEVTPKWLRRMFENERRRMHFDTVEDFKCQESSFGALTLWILWKRTIRGSAAVVNLPREERKAREARNGADKEKKKSDSGIGINLPL